MSFISSEPSFQTPTPWDSRLRSRTPMGLPDGIRKTVVRARKLLDRMEAAETPDHREQIGQEIDVILASISKYQRSVGRKSVGYDFLTNFCRGCRKAVFEANPKRGRKRSPEAPEERPTKRRLVHAKMHPEAPPAPIAEAMEVELLSFPPPAPPPPPAFRPPPPPALLPILKAVRAPQPTKIKPPAHPLSAPALEPKDVETAEYESLLHCLNEASTPEVLHSCVERSRLFIQSSDSSEHIASIERWAASQPTSPELSDLIGACPEAKVRATLIEATQGFIKAVGQGKAPLAEMRAYAEANRSLFDRPSTATQIFTALYEKVAQEAQRRDEISARRAEIPELLQVPTYSQKVQAAVDRCITRQECDELKSAFEAAAQRLGPQAPFEQVRAAINKREKELELEEQRVGELQATYKIPETAARAMVRGMRNEWADFYSLVNGIPVQLHGISGLKIYHDHEGKLCADYGLETLGEGGRKRAKEFVRMWPSGETRSLVRSTKKQREMDPAEAAHVFSEEKAFELGIRKELAEAGQKLEQPRVSNKELQSVVLWQWEGEPYIDSHGNRKIRLFSEKASGDLKVFVKKQWLKPVDIQAIFAATSIMDPKNKTAPNLNVL